MKLTNEQINLLFAGHESFEIMRNLQEQQFLFMYFGGGDSEQVTNLLVKCFKDVVAEKCFMWEGDLAEPK